MNLLDLLGGNSQPGGLAGTLMGGQQAPTGLAALLQSAQNPGAMALSGQQPAPPGQPMDEQMRPQPGGMPPTMQHKGMGWRNILGAIGDGLTAAGGGQPTYGPGQQRLREQEQEQRQADQQYQRQRTDNNADWQTREQWKVDHPGPTPLQQNVSAYSALPEGSPERSILERGIAGYGYSPEVMAARQAQQEALIQARLNAGQTLKGTPTYAATHPKPGTAGGGGFEYRMVDGKLMKRRVQ